MEVAVAELETETAVDAGSNEEYWVVVCELSTDDALEDWDDTSEDSNDVSEDEVDDSEEAVEDSDDELSSVITSVNSHVRTSLLASLLLSGIVTDTLALTVKEDPLMILPLNSTRKPLSEYSSDRKSNEDKSVVLTE